MRSSYVYCKSKHIPAHGSYVRIAHHRLPCSLISSGIVYVLIPRTPDVQTDHLSSENPLQLRRGVESQVLVPKIVEFLVAHIASEISTASIS